MKIDFNNELTGFQQARQLHMILEHYAASKHCNDSDRDIIENLNEQIETILNKPEFSEFKNQAEEESPETSRHSFLDSLSSFWHGLLGPSRLELKLSEQRRQLIERAERAEAMAFEALAEMAEIGKQRDDALFKTRELEGQIANKANS